MSVWSELKSRRIPITVAMLALWTGGAFYLFLRRGDLVFHHWLEIFWPELQINSLIPDQIHSKLHYPKWVVYTLPNGLWAMAYTLLISAIWWKERTAIKYVWLGTIPVLVVGFEMLQYTGYVRGTFSMGDLILGIVGMIIGVLINKNFTYEKIDG